MLSEVTGPRTECQQGASQQKDILTPIATYQMSLSSRSAGDHAPLPNRSSATPAGAPVPPSPCIHSTVIMEQSLCPREGIERAREKERKIEDIQTSHNRDSGDAPLS